MAPDGVVLLKPGCHGGTCLGAGAEVVVRQQLELQRGVERLRDRVVQRRTGAPHRLAYPGPGTGGGEQISGVLPALIRVEDHPGDVAAAYRDGDLQGGRGQLRVMVSIHGVPDRPA